MTRVAAFGQVWVSHMSQTTMAVLEASQRTGFSIISHSLVLAADAARLRVENDRTVGLFAADVTRLLRMRSATAIRDELSGEAFIGLIAPTLPKGDARRNPVNGAQPHSRPWRPHGDRGLAAIFEIVLFA